MATTRPPPLPRWLLPILLLALLFSYSDQQSQLQQQQQQQQQQQKQQQRIQYARANDCLLIRTTIGKFYESVRLMRQTTPPTWHKLSQLQQTTFVHVQKIDECRVQLEVNDVLVNSNRNNNKNNNNKFAFNQLYLRKCLYFLLSHYNASLQSQPGAATISERRDQPPPDAHTAFSFKCNAHSFLVKLSRSELTQVGRIYADLLNAYDDAASSSRVPTGVDCWTTSPGAPASVVSLSRSLPSAAASAIRIARPLMSPQDESRGDSNANSDKGRILVHYVTGKLVLYVGVLSLLSLMGVILVFHINAKMPLAKHLPPELRDGHHAAQQTVDSESDPSHSIRSSSNSNSNSQKIPRHSSAPSQKDCRTKDKIDATAMQTQVHADVCGLFLSGDHIAIKHQPTMAAKRDGAHWSWTLTNSGEQDDTNNAPDNEGDRAMHVVEANKLRRPENHSGADGGDMRSECSTTDGERMLYVQQWLVGTGLDPSASFKLVMQTDEDEDDDDNDNENYDKSVNENNPEYNHHHHHYQKELQQPQQNQQYQKRSKNKRWRFLRAATTEAGHANCSIKIQV